MSSLVKIRTKIPGGLLERLDDLVENYDVSRADFLRSAIEHEIKRREIEALREEIAILEINATALKEGESLAIDESGEISVVTSENERCELCQTELGPITRKFDGPLFCEECVALAKGGDFSVFQADF